VGAPQLPGTPLQQGGAERAAPLAPAVAGEGRRRRVAALEVAAARPGLGDDPDVLQVEERVVGDGLQHGVGRVRPLVVVLVGLAEHRGLVEAEAVDVHL
jgi:hypothetical protein